MELRHLREALAHFERTLFEQPLPPCLIYAIDGDTAEYQEPGLIGIGVDLRQSPLDALCALCHEMAHHWDCSLHGIPSEPHNARWWQRMRHAHGVTHALKPGATAFLTACDDLHWWTWETQR